MLKFPGLILMIVGALVACPGLVIAQVSGRVVDSDGRPLPAVPVQLWSGARRLDVQSTSAEGTFAFNEVREAGALRLTAQMLGYARAQQEVSSPSRDLKITMVAEAVQLEGLMIEAPPIVRCPQRDDPAARELWASLYSRYDHTQDSLGISFYARRYDATVTRQQIGEVDEDRLVRTWYGAKGADRRFYTSAQTYGYPITSSMDPAYGTWRYRDLGSFDVGHFLDEAFGRTHTFRILATQRDAVMLGFCPMGSTARSPTIEGTLMIGSDTSLVKAEWRFQTPGRREDAGAEITFVPRGRSPIPILPAQTLYWRRIAGRREMYFQRWVRFATYEFLPRNEDPVSPSQWLTER